MKKIVSLMLCLAMIISANVSVFATDDSFTLDTIIEEVSEEELFCEEEAEPETGALTYSVTCIPGKDGVSDDEVSLYAAQGSVATPGSPVIFVVDTTGKTGSTVLLDINLSNNPGIALVSFYVHYDSEAMTLKNATLGEIFTGELDCNFNPVPFVFNVFSGAGDKTNSGKLVTLEFEIAEDCPEGEYEISLTDLESINIDEENVYFDIENGKITVTNVIPGDVNGDGEVTRMDLLRLAKHFSGFEVVIDEAAANVNGDDSVTRMDLLRLAKHFSGFDVELESSIPECTHTNLKEVSEEEASCTEDGNIAYWKCKCGKLFADSEATEEIKLEDTIVPAGHTPGEGATCTEAQVCTECGEVLEESNGHTPSEAVRENEVEKTCKVEGTYDEVVYCSECGEEMSRTHKSEGYGEHTPGEGATCTESQVCTECGEVLEEAKGHKYSDVWSSDSEYHWHAATCGHNDEISDYGEHTLNSSHICTACSYDASASYKLATPDNVKVSYDRVTWDAVANADYYTVRVNGDYEIIQRGTSAPLSAAVNQSGEKLFANESGINKHGEVSVTVRANDNGNYSASDFSDGVSYYYIPEAEESDNRTLADNYRLGNGYNLVEQTFTTGIKAEKSVFNIDKLFAIDTFSHNNEGNGGYLESYYFTSTDEYVSNMTESCDITSSISGGYGPVSASLKTDLSYSSSENYKSHKYNATYISRFDQIAGTTTFGMHNSNIRVHALSDQFVQDIRRENPDLRLYSDDELCEYLFDTYGTHAALGIQRGANFVTSYVISTDSEEDNRSATAMFRTGANANVANFFNASFDVNSQGSNTITLNSETTTSTLKSSFYGGEVKSGIADGKASIEDWNGNVNTVTIGLAEAIAISSLIKQVETEYGVYLGENGASLGEKFEEYINTRATSAYYDLYSQYTYDPPFNVNVNETEDGNVLVIDLSKYQGTGSLEGAGCAYLAEGVFTVYPNMLGKRIDKIKVVSSFDNNDIAEKNLIDGFSIALSNKWKRDVEVEFENIGVRALENGLVDKSKTSSINVKTSFKGINLVEQNDGTNEMYIVTDSASYKVALGLENGEELFVSTIYMDDDTVILPVAEKIGYSFAGWKTPDGQMVTKKDGTLYTSVDLSKLTLLHADWTLEQYEITLDNDYATIIGTETIIEHYGYMFADSEGKVLNKIVIPEKTGYTFEGYFKKVENNGYSDVVGFEQVISKDGTIMVEPDEFAAHTTIYAMYKPVTYAVNLYVDSEFYGRFFEIYGEMICDENEESIRKIAKVPEKAGYTFNGFSCNLGQIVDKDGYIIPAVYENYKTFTEDTDIHAVWIANEYEVTFDSNGSNAKIDPIYIAYGETYGTLPALSREGYTFNGWKLENALVTANTVMKSTENHTLVADWAAHTYTFEYYGNGATSGSTASSFHTYDVAKKLTVNGFAKIGYNFGGWNTNADGSGTPFANEEEILNYTATNGAVIKLYAQWPAGNNVTVKFNANGGNASFAEKDVVYDGKYGTLPTATKTGHLFEGWYTALTGGTKITESTVVNVTSAQTLYAHWKANSYTATWTVPVGATITVNRTSSPNANAATGKITSGATVYYGDVLSVSYAASNNAYNLTNKGLNSITVTGNVNSSQIYANTQIKSYTAQWSSYTGVNIAVKRTSSPYAGAFIGNLSSGATVYYGDVLSVTYSANTGYTLSSKGSTSIVVTGNVNSSQIYASATANAYTVTYNANGGTGTTSQSKHTYNVSAKLSANGFSRTNYTFLGWSTSASATTPTYTNQQYVSNLTTVNGGNVTLYAVWVKTEYSISASGVNKNITNDNNNYLMTISPGMNRDALKANGYKNLELHFRFKGRGTNPFTFNVPKLSIYSNTGTEVYSGTHNSFEGAWGVWTWRTVDYTMSINDIQANGGFSTKWSTSGGSGSDGWCLDEYEITIKAVK